MDKVHPAPAAAGGAAETSSSTTVPYSGLPGTNFERTFIAIKPDGVERGLMGNIVGRFEKKGYKLVACKLTSPTLDQAQKHYADLSTKGFYKGLCEYFSSGPILAMVWEGKNAILGGRTLLGATNPADSLPGTIRGDLCIDTGRNIIHGSDGPEAAKTEIEFWFTEPEVCEWTSHSSKWVYEDGAAVKSEGGKNSINEGKEEVAVSENKNEERTFIAIKPDGVQRGLCGNIVARFEKKGFKLAAMKLIWPTQAMAAGHYDDLKAKKFFGGLVSYFSSGPILAMVWEGLGSIKTGRVLLGATNPADSLPGTIRGDLCIDIGRNICHGSDSPEGSKHEVAFWFKPTELCAYKHHSAAWVYESP
jgi:nucleoside-diphosphate kinase